MAYKTLHVDINATVSIYLTELYGFGERELGIFYVAGVLGTLIGWLVLSVDLPSKTIEMLNWNVQGHWFHDIVARTYAKHHSNHFEPAARLWVSYPTTIIMFVVVLLFGFALQRHWHYMVIAVLFAAQVVGIMIATVGIYAYLLDAYPEGSGKAGAWTDFGKLQRHVVTCCNIPLPPSIR